MTNITLFLAGSKSELWNQCVADFLTEARSERTRKSYQLILRRFFSNPLKSPEAYTRADVLRFLENPCRGHRNTGSAPSAATQNQRLACISSFFKFSSTYLVELNGQMQALYQKPSPTARLHARQTPQLPRGMSVEDLRCFFSSIPRNTVLGLRDFSLFWGLYVIGIRVGEWLSLRYSDIEAATFIDNGQARQGWRFRFNPSKRSASPQWRELPGTVKSAIDAYLLASGRLATIQADDPIFVSTSDSVSSRLTLKPVRLTTMQARFKRYLKVSGLDPDAHSIHSLRHSSAQARYLASGGDILAVQQALGHNSPVTSIVYIRRLMGESDTLASKIESAFSSLGEV